MFLNTRSLFALTAVLALAANACSATPQRAVRATPSPHVCSGGVIATANDAARFAGCTTVVGALRIENSTLADLTSLESLQSVSGTLTVAHNSALTDLSGLEGLSAVASLRLVDNPELADLSALSALHSAKAVEIRSNPALTNLRGLEGLSTLKELALVDNGLFETSGLSSLREAGELTIASNRRLISLRGLNGLQHAGSVSIRNNPRLCARLGLLPKLRDVTDALELSSNSGLSQHELQILQQQVNPAFDRAVVASR